MPNFENPILNFENKSLNFENAESSYVQPITHYEL